MNKKIFSFFLLMLGLQQAFGQLADSEKFKKRAANANNVVIISPSYNAQFPFGNMKDRFGFNSNVGMMLSYRFGKSWIAGVEGNYLFGNKVKENNILANITTSEGKHITNEGYLVDTKLSEEGFSVKAVGGKVFRVSKRLPGSGIFLLGGLGYLQHKILIQAPTRLVPQLDKTYRKGYDRLSNGPVLSLGTGFMFMERKKLLNFYLGCQADIAFTRNIRAWNFDQGKKDNTQRKDIFVGVKFGFIIPVYTNKDNEDLY